MAVGQACSRFHPDPIARFDSDLALTAPNARADLLGFPTIHSLCWRRGCRNDCARAVLIALVHKCLTIVDEHARECLAIDVAGSIRSRRVIEVLAQLISTHSAPRYLRSDNETEFVSQALLKWMQEENIETALIDPGKPWQNGTDESFNGKLRDECLSLEWFRSRTEARVVIGNWRRHCNAVRPHSSLQYLPPHAFKQQHHPSPNRAVFQE